MKVEFHDEYFIVVLGVLWVLCFLRPLLRCVGEGLGGLIPPTHAPVAPPPRRRAARCAAAQGGRRGDVARGGGGGAEARGGGGGAARAADRGRKHRERAGRRDVAGVAGGATRAAVRAGKRGRVSTGRVVAKGKLARQGHLPVATPRCAESGRARLGIRAVWAGATARIVIRLCGRAVGPAIFGSPFFGVRVSLLCEL